MDILKPWGSCLLMLHGKLHSHEGFFVTDDYSGSIKTLRLKSESIIHFSGHLHPRLLFLRCYRSRVEVTPDAVAVE